MTNTATTSAPEANRLRARAQGAYNAALAHAENVRAWVSAGSGSFTHDQLVVAESTLKTKKAQLASAIAVAEAADAGIEQTDNKVSDYLLELFEANRHEFRLAGAAFDIRKRPGKEIPKALPEVAFVQQANSTSGSGAVTGEAFVVVYGEKTNLPTIDPQRVAQAAGKLGGKVEVDNTIVAEPLGTTDSGVEVWRKHYRVLVEHAYPKVPVLLDPPSKHAVNLVASGLARELQSINVTAMPYGATMSTGVRIVTSTDPEKTTVEVNGNERRATFVVMVGTTAHYGNFGYDEILTRAGSRIAAYGKGVVLGSLGRIKSTSILHSTPVNQSSARITVEMVGEARIA